MYLDLLAKAHMQRRTVHDHSELSPAERQDVQELNDAFRSLMHDLVLMDATSGNEQSWAPVREATFAAVHCKKCSGTTLGAAIAIIAELAYKVDPEMTRDNFNARYRKLMDL